ncbi:MAG: hypothetical protein BWY09_03225 [Candidatus Hydrogenedentes bacterium ADurb.Bin179]|nr:MAG: hypothetical protein BWY09_03225 [Candidatus Hydrogenedentes bacterium ADurb.Bin179]
MLVQLTCPFCPLGPYLFVMLAGDTLSFIYPTGFTHHGSPIHISVFIVRA